MAEQALLLHAGKINDIIRCSRVAPKYGDKDKLQRRWYLSSFCAEVAGRVSCCVSFTLQAFCELHACEQGCVLIKYVRVVIQGISIPTLHGSRPMCSDLCGGAHTAAAQACMMHTLQPQNSRFILRRMREVSFGNGDRGDPGCMYMCRTAEGCAAYADDEATLLPHNADVTRGESMEAAGMSKIASCICVTCPLQEIGLL